MAPKRAKRGKTAKEKALGRLLRRGSEETGRSLRSLETEPWAPSRQTIAEWEDKDGTPLDQLLYVIGLASEARAFRDDLMAEIDSGYPDLRRSAEQVRAENLALRERLKELEAESLALKNDKKWLARILAAVLNGRPYPEPGRSFEETVRLVYDLEQQRAAKEQARREFYEWLRQPLNRAHRARLEVLIHAGAEVGAIVEEAPFDPFADFLLWVIEGKDVEKELPRVLSSYKERRKNRKAAWVDTYRGFITNIRRVPWRA